MKKLALALVATMFALGISALTVSAQTQPGIGSLHAQAQNFTPIVKQAACNGTWGPYCGPGWVRRCWRGPYGYPHCRCVPC
jgi:Spy/CpxP family protein refolding chaperone